MTGRLSAIAGTVPRSGHSTARTPNRLRRRREGRTDHRWRRRYRCSAGAHSPPAWGHRGTGRRQREFIGNGRALIRVTASRDGDGRCPRSGRHDRSRANDHRAAGQNRRRSGQRRNHPSPGNIAPDRSRRLRSCARRQSHRRLQHRASDHRRGDPQQWAHRRRVIGGVVRPRFGRRFVHDQQGWGRSARPGAASRGCRLRRYCRHRVLRDGGYTTCTRHTRRRRDRPQTRRSTTRSPPSSNLPGPCRHRDRRRDRAAAPPGPLPPLPGNPGRGDADSSMSLPTVTWQKTNRHTT